MKIFALVPMTIYGMVLDSETTEHKVAFEHNFCNGNGAEITPTCNGDKMPTLVKKWTEAADVGFRPWDENADQEFGYTCINDQGTVKVRLPENLPTDYLLASGLVDFNSDDFETISANEIEFALPVDGKSTDNGITTYRATLGTKMQTVSSPTGQPKVKSYGENYKIECQIRTGSSSPAKTTTTRATTTEATTACVCPTATTTRATTTRPTAPPTVRYEVTVETSEYWHSGTDDALYIELVGKTGTSGMKRLSTYTGNYYRGSTVTASIRAPFHGELEKVVMFKGGADAWQASGSRPMKIQYYANGQHYSHQISNSVKLEESNPVWTRNI